MNAGDATLGQEPCSTESRAIPHPLVDATRVLSSGCPTMWEEAAARADKLRREVRLSGDIGTLDQLVLLSWFLTHEPGCDRIRAVVAWTNLSDALGRAHQWQQGRLDLAEEAVVTARWAIKLMEGLPRRQPVLEMTTYGVLSFALEGRYLDTAAAGDLGEAVAAARVAVMHSENYDEYRSSIVDQFASVVACLAKERNNDAELFDLAVEATRTALSLTPESAPEWKRRQYALVNLLIEQEVHGGVLGGAERALEIFTGLDLDAADADDLALIAQARCARYVRTGDLTEIIKAADLAESALERMDKLWNRNEVVPILAQNVLLEAFRGSGQHRYLVLATSSIRTALETFDLHPKARKRLTLRYLNILVETYKGIRDGQYLNEAQNLARGMLDELRNHVYDMESRMLLVSLIDAMYMNSGEIEILYEGLEVIRGARQNFPTAGEDWRLLTSEGIICSRLAEHTGDIAMARIALDALEAAAGVAEDRKPYLLGPSLMNLAMCARQTYRLTREVTFVRRAVDISRNATGLRSSHYSEHLASQQELALGLSELYKATKEIAALVEGIACARLVVEARSDSVGSRMLLADLLLDHQRATASSLGPARSRSLIEEAIGHMRAARELVVDGPHDSWIRSMLGLAFYRLYRVQHDRHSLSEAVRYFREAATSDVLAPRFRVEDAYRLAQIAAHAGDYSEALDALSLAIVDLLPRLVSRGLSRESQEKLLAGDSGKLAPMAASFAAHLHSPTRAAKLLEAGRGVLLAQALATRTDVSELERSAPTLAREFVELRAALDPDMYADAGPGQPDHALHLRRRRQVYRWTDLLAEIRALPGYSRFLLPLQERDLLAAANEGPIVLLNAADLRSDAFIITSDGILHLPLPTARKKTIERRARRLARVVNSQDPERDERPALETLEWLWDHVVFPVLDRLEFRRLGPDQQPPRLWWVASGAFGYLPLHAAGHHATSTGATDVHAFRYVTSSSAPTIRTLIESRTRLASVRRLRVSAVSMASTPGQSDLPAADQEATLIQSLLGARLLQGGAVTKDRVARLVRTSSVVHFACHGIHEPLDPGASRLLLKDQPFTVRDLSAMKLDGAELAFLSACSTATGDDYLSEESINVASSFQLAGFRQVIGTLWPIADAPALRTARRFYRGLGARDQVDVRQAPFALHAAVESLRNVNAEAPSAWAAYVHVGI